MLHSQVKLMSAALLSIIKKIISLTEVHKGFKEVPHYQSGSNRHIKRVFCAALRQFYAVIACIYHLLLHAFNLVSHHYGIFFTSVDSKLWKANTIMHLLDGTNIITFALEIFHTLEYILIICPANRIFSSKGCFMYVGVRRSGSDAA